LSAAENETAVAGSFVLIVITAAQFLAPAFELAFHILTYNVEKDSRGRDE